MARACSSDISRFQATEESEGTERAECVAGLWFVERCIGDTAVEALQGRVSMREDIVIWLLLGIPRNTGCTRYTFQSQCRRPVRHRC